MCSAFLDNQPTLSRQCVHTATVSIAHMATNTRAPFSALPGSSADEQLVNAAAYPCSGLNQIASGGKAYTQVTVDTPLWLRGILEGLSLFPRLAGGWFWEVPHGGRIQARRHLRWDRNPLIQPDGHPWLDQQWGLSHIKRILSVFAHHQKSFFY